MASIIESSDDLMSDINVTPLVDVMLVLLAIFMVTATIVVSPMLPVLLPGAGTGEKTPAKRVEVTLQADGQMVVNGKPALIDDLRIIVEKAGDPSLIPAILAADESVSHGSVVAVLDEFRRLGVTHIGVKVKKQ